MTYSNEKKSILQALGIPVYQKVVSDTAINNIISSARKSDENPQTKTAPSSTDKQRRISTARERLNDIRQQFESAPSNKSNTERFEDVDIGSSDNDQSADVKSELTSISSPGYDWIPAMREALFLTTEQVKFVDIPMPDIEADILFIPLHWSQSESSLKQKIWEVYRNKHSKALAER